MLRLGVRALCRCSVAALPAIGLTCLCVLDGCERSDFSRERDDLADANANDGYDGRQEDGSVTPSAAGWCDSQDATFCSDFDRESITQTWTLLPSASTGMLDLDPFARSGPNSVRIRFPEDAGANTCLRRYLQRLMPGRGAHARAALDVWVGRLDGGGFPTSTASATGSIGKPRLLVFGGAVTDACGCLRFGAHDERRRLRGHACRDPSNHPDRRRVAPSRTRVGSVATHCGCSDLARWSSRDQSHADPFRVQRRRRLYAASGGDLRQRAHRNSNRQHNVLADGVAPGQCPRKTATIYLRASYVPRGFAEGWVEQGSSRAPAQIAGVACAARYRTVPRRLAALFGWRSLARCSSPLVLGSALSVMRRDDRRSKGSE